MSLTEMFRPAMEAMEQAEQKKIVVPSPNGRVSNHEERTKVSTVKIEPATVVAEKHATRPTTPTSPTEVTSTLKSSAKPRSGAKPTREMNGDETVVGGVPGVPLPHKAGQSPREVKERRRLLGIIYFLIFAFTLLGFREIQRWSKPDEGAATTAFLASRVKHFKQETGLKLNRERTAVEFENYKSAPEIDPSATKEVDADPMEGLPLAGEEHHRKSSRDRAEEANLNFAENRIRQNLKEQDYANQIETQERQQYIEQFVANAARDGLKVDVDENGQVKVTGRRRPSGSSGGALR